VPRLDFTSGGSAWLANPQRRIIAEITGIEWTTHSDPDYAGELYDTGGFDIQMHPDAVSPNDAARTKVDVLVQVDPPLEDIPIRLDWRDVDDPSDDDGPIDEDPDPTGPGERPANGRDNYSLEPDLPSPSLPASGATNASGEVRVTFDVGDRNIQPGNNFRVIAGARQADVDRVLAKAADSDSEVFYDENGNARWNSGEVTLDDEMNIHGCVSTRVLTIWRYLYVEVDSMGAPPPETQFPDDALAIDAAPGDIPAPDTGLLYAAFEPAYIEVVVGTAYDEPTIPFVYHVVDATAASRGIGQSDGFWSAYIAGAYEGETELDNDPDTESARWGETMSEEPECSFIYFEVLRDVHNDGEYPNWDNGVYPQAYDERQSVVHEIGHQFSLWTDGTHPPAGESIMSLPQHDPEVVLPPDTFSELELLIIRSRRHP